MAEFARALQTQNIWFAAQQYKDAEIKLVQQRLGLGAGDAPSSPVTAAPASPVESKAAAMISDLKKELTTDSNNSIKDVDSMLNRVAKLEQENNEIKKQLQDALARLEQLESSSKPAAPVAAVCPAGPPAKAPAKEESEDEDDDDDCDFFDDSDSEDDEAKAAQEALKAKRIAEYNERKAAKAATKGVVAAKSMITLDVKPFDDETDLDALAAKIKSEIAMPGLVWGQKHEKKPLAFGIFKLVVTAVVEDDKVSTDDLTEKIEEYEDEVQSVDIAAFNKL
jgi:translation elongation factor EF-1beta